MKGRGETGDRRQKADRYYLVLANDLRYDEASGLMSPLVEVSRLLHAYSKAILTSTF